MKNIRYAGLAILCLSPVKMLAQTETGFDKILSRLDQMEQDNRKLMQEIQALRQELAAYKSAAPSTDTSENPPGPTMEERVDVQERRTEELAQTKVEASQRMPVSLTGMLLFNSFLNGSNSRTSQYPVVASPLAGARYGGASLRQTVLGLTFDGPDVPWGGKAGGSLYMDFFAGSGQPDNNLLRIRVATLELKWKNTTFAVAQDKPIIAPREPDSLAQVGVSPLTAAGNLWNWDPQVRVERRVSLGENSGLRAQAGVYQTDETDSTVPPAYTTTLERARPGYEGRFEFWHKADSRRFEIAPGFHLSTTHVAGTSVNSRIASLDWLFRPVSFVQVTGAWFRGQDVSGLGALRQGFTIISPGVAIPVHSVGGWTQVALFPTSKLSFHLYGGEQRDRASDLPNGGITWNFVYAGNFMYRLAPNVVGSFEASQTRTHYLNIGTRLNNHYDLALAYLF